MILANPPFKGSLDESRRAPVADRQGEDEEDRAALRGAHPADAEAGRPGGVHRAGRRALRLVEGPRGAARACSSRRTSSRPSSRCRPACSSPTPACPTAILVFTKGGKTDHVLFYKMESDGFTLDDKRDKIGDGLGDLPDIRKQWFAREKAKKNDRKAKHFFVPVKEIEENKYDLSISRYRETEYEEANTSRRWRSCAAPARWTTRFGGTWMNWRPCFDD